VEPARAVEPQRAVAPARAAPLVAGEERPTESASCAPTQLGATWPAIVSLVREGNALLGAVIEDSAPLRVLDGELTVGFPQSSSFNKRKAESAAHREVLSAAIATLTGERLRLAFELCEELNGVGSEPPEGTASGEELLRTIIAEFNAEELPSSWTPGGSETEGGR
ncbi:MAG: hypothetical protein ACYCYN_10870, partial [Solirubrobacteraceae bacterium]